MTKTELIKGILENAKQLKDSCGIETVMIIDEMEKLIDTYSEQLNLHSVRRSAFLVQHETGLNCGLFATLKNAEESIKHTTRYKVQEIEIK